MADAFEHFRITTLNAFGVDPMHYYITAPQMNNSLFLKVTMEGDHGKSNLTFLGEKWVQYIIRISTDEGMSEEHLKKMFMDHIGGFVRTKAFG